ncbi:hypothetical protein BKA59DRAFT_411003 [Fusarium tricinctum]|uniref:Uncharacterized protein n=1 Tax=Fusarium tricinctum TaxID=61284 RepID=A0A8K0S5T2_9HYPO|nr:hypothetical protein BKA59DRAFT_411003 [Fusarium tricinctum]
MLAATRIWRSERLVHSHSAAPNVLRSTVSLHSKCDQCRSFSSSPTSSISSQDRNARRNGSMGLQRPVPLVRNISWENRSRAAFRRAMKGFNQPTDASKFASMDQVKTWASDLCGLRPGANIEDVERSAIDHLLRGDKKANIHKATFTHGHHFSGPRAIVKTSKNTRLSAAYEEETTFIDPITNRRVSKPLTLGRAARYEDLAGYEPTDFVDVSAKADSTPKYNDLDKYKPTKDVATEQQDQNEYEDLDKYQPVVDERSTQDQSVKYDDLDKYGPVKHNEPDGKLPNTTEEDSKEYDDLHKYSSSTLDSPLSQHQLAAEQQSKLYDDLDQYKPTFWNEPDGKRVQSVEELSKNYDDLQKYEAVYWNEPDGLRERSSEEASKDYKDLNSYGPVTWSEPDGLRRLTPEEESKKYDDLESYEAPFEASRSILKAHEKAQMDTKMRGKPLAPKVDAPVEDFASKYDDLHKYGPVRWNEPDGLRKLTSEELSKNYDDLYLYGAVRWNEPDGLRPLSAEEKSKRYKDTHLYAARDTSSPTPRVHPEEASKVYKDLPGYREFDNADESRPRTHPEEVSKQYTDLNAYAAFENDGSQVESVHPALSPKEYKDLHKYPSAGFEETTMFQHVHPEELTKNYTDLGSYRPSGFTSQAQAYPAHPEEALKVYQDLHQYASVSHNESKVPNGPMSVPLDEVARGLREFDSKAGSQDPLDTTSSAYYRNPNRSFPDSTETSVDDVDSGSAEAIRAAVLRRAHENSQKFKGQALTDSNNDHTGSQQVSQEQKLTGNYARDFPEEFVVSWSKQNSSSKSALYPNNRGGEPDPVEEAIEENVEPESMDGSFPIEDVKLQPALDRYAGKGSKDSYSHKPQGLQTSYSEECGHSTMPISQKHYTTADCKTEANTISQEPHATLYKILAFDPTSKMMSVAQATSTVDTNESPMSLADALVHLKEPAKFLPYFKSLQDQGYEVISGSGHVLVFRQMRPALERSADAAASAIDEMVIRGGTFPTSDSISTNTTGQAYKRRGNGRSASAKADNSTKKRHIGRKLLVGTVGVAGSAYAVAMLAEYSSTKRLDPKNPQTPRT